MINVDNVLLDESKVLNVRKKPIIIKAIQINNPEGFTVTTMEGLVNGKCGDYLMIGVNGEKYPCDKEIFEKTYDIIE
jgi:hypothetical protein